MACIIDMYILSQETVNYIKMLQIITQNFVCSVFQFDACTKKNGNYENCPMLA